MFEKYRRKSASARLVEEQLYEQVVVELSNGQKRTGLWAKALANCDGVEERAKSLYIQYRVQSIKDEILTEPSSNKDHLHSFEYKNVTIKHNFLRYWVEGKSFDSAQEAKKFIDNQVLI